MYLRRIFFFILVSSSFIRSELSSSIDFTGSKAEVTTAIEASFKEPFLLNEFIFKDDSSFSLKSEFSQLAELKKGQLVKPNKIKDAVNYFFDKNQLNRIIFTIKKRENGSDLICQIESDWVLGNLTFSGLAVGGNRYLQFYDNHVGERFSLEKHEASLERIKQVFDQKGYKAFSLREKIKKDEGTKRVYVHLICKKGRHFTIGAVEVKLSASEGLLVKEDQTIIARKLKRALQNKRYDEEVINKQTKFIEQLLVDKGFSKISIKLQEVINLSESTVDLNFSLQVDQKRQLTFVGNYFFNDSELRGFVTKFGFSVGVLPSSLLAQDIAAEYHKHGFWDVEIEDYEEKDGKTYFVIKEGARVTVRQVVLKGVDTFNAKSLSNRFFNRFTLQKFFSDKSLQKALDRLTSFYRDHGFWDVTVLKKSFSKINELHDYRLTITLDQGEQRFLEKVEIPTFPHLLLLGPFLKITQARKPIIFDVTFLKEQRAWLQNHFKKQGYLWVKAEPTLVANEGVYRISWNVEPGDQVLFGNVLQRGAFDVQHKLVQGVFGIKPGTIWRKERIQLGYARLKELDVFKQIRIQPLQIKNKNERDVVLYLQNDEPFEVRTRIGFQQVSRNFALKKGSTYKVGSSLLWRNPTRHADLLRFDADLTRFEQRYDGSYRMPFLLDPALLVTFKGYSHNYTQPLIVGSNKTLYNVAQQGFLSSFSKQTLHTNTAINLGCEWMEMTDISIPLAEALHFKTTLINKKIPYFVVEPSLFIDLLDDKINPTKGIYLAASLKGMFPLKPSTYMVKLLLEKGIFFPFFKQSKTVFAARVRFGHVFNECYSKIMPPERFYLGGANSLRGYLPDSCPPLGTFQSNGKIQRIAQGGKTMVNMNLELRMPLVQQLNWVVFQDFGVLVEELSDLNLGKNNLASTGFGLRYQTSMGPLRFDIGWKWQKPFPEDTRYAWFLTFGHTF